MRPLLEVRDLKTYFFTEEGVVKAVDGVGFTIQKGEIFGLVGESGCGKTVTALSILRLLDVPGKVMNGNVHFDGTSLLELPAEEMTSLRGNRISMIFQQPLSSLDPVFTIGDQVAEVFQTHRNMSKKEAWERSVGLLRLVGIPDAEERAHTYPHEMSGGQAQRVMIAIALALDPELLIADEPTTALDVTIQAQILDLMRDLIAQRNTSLLLITHNLGIISEMVNRLAVMYAGRIVEQANVDALFDRPLHPYTQGLIGSIPVLGKVEERLEVVHGSVPNLIDLPPGCRFAPRCLAMTSHGIDICTEREPDLRQVQPDHFVRCWLYQSDQDYHPPFDGADIAAQMKVPRIHKVKQEKPIPLVKPNGRKTLVEVKDLVKYFPVTGGLFKRTVAWLQAVDGVSFTIKEGETLGLVGESGCGKTTVGLSLLRLIEPTSGSVTFDHQDVLQLRKSEINSLRRVMQIIFQDPYSSLDPRMPIGKSIAEGLNIHKMANRNDRYDLVIDVLRKVGLEEYHYHRYPHEFSGGQRQRIGIARTLILRPKLIVTDEPVSALDVSIQSQVLNLLKDLQDEYGLTYLFIAHDLSVVEHISDRVAVMYLGRIIELAERENLFTNPLHPYSLALMSAIPIANPHLQRQRVILPGDVPSPIHPPAGCRFHPRCPSVMDHCRVQEPMFKEASPNHWVACWRNE